MKTDDRAGLGERERTRRATQSRASRLAWPISEGAHRIGVGRTSIYKLAAEGKIRLVKVAGRTLIPDSEIERLVEGEAK
jgi:excisionase family DNA binding protein